MTGIFYFSGTGNSLYLAKKVKEALGGQIKYIPTYGGTGREFERLILVTPIYSFGMPTFVYDFIPRLDKTKELVVIQNYGGMVSGADYLLYQHAQKHGVKLRAIYTIKMPENFTLEVSVPKLYLNHTLKSADTRIEKIIRSMEAGEKRLPKPRKTKEATYLENKANWHIIGERFHVTDACVKCGKCVNLCPAQNIQMIEDKITFSNQCVACLGCYHRCPQKAIIYRGKRKKDRYFNPNVNEKELGKDL